MSTNYHTPIPGPPAQPDATSELFNSRFSTLDSGISRKVDSTGNGSNITSEVSVAATRRNLTSGGTLKVIFSEIQKWLSDMKAVAFSASYNDLIDQPTAMTPTTHAATHKTGGSDALKAVDIGAVSEVLPGSNVTVSKNPDTGAVTINAAGGGSGGSAHIIANDGAALPNQGTLDFGTGLTAADDPATFKTAVSLDMGAIQIGKAQINDMPVFDSGMFSPTVRGMTIPGNPIYTTKIGRYTRIGSLIIISLNISASSMGGAVGSLRVDGLPFPVRETTAIALPFWTGGFDIWGGIGSSFGNGSNTGMLLRKTGNAANLTAEEITGSFSLLATFNYLTS